jgi:hypothetical protein
VKPEPPNGIITQYTVIYTDLYSNISTNISVANTTQTVLTGLHPFTNYTITVVPWTSVGPCSSPQNIMATTLVGYPYEPYITSVEAVSATTVSVTWSLETDRPTGPDTWYIVTATDTVNNSQQFTASSTGIEVKSVLVAGLDEYWEYQVSMVAYTVDINNTQYAVQSVNTRAVRTLESSTSLHCYDSLLLHLDS